MTLINQAVPDCLVTGYEHLIDQLSLPNPNDRHVLAAATRSGAQMIVTTNLKDFPKAVLADFEIVPVIRMRSSWTWRLYVDPAIVTTAGKLQRAALRSPPLSTETFVDTLQRQGLPGVADVLRSRIELI